MTQCLRVAQRKAWVAPLFWFSSLCKFLHTSCFFRKLLLLFFPFSDDCSCLFSDVTNICYKFQLSAMLKTCRLAITKYVSSFLCLWFRYRPLNTTKCLSRQRLHWQMIPQDALSYQLNSLLLSFHVKNITFTQCLEKVRNCKLLQKHVAQIRVEIRIRAC